MGFATPLALLGLATLAVPVLIHLIQRERKRVVPFPSLMFLRRIPYQSIRRRRIRHWILLALRLAALALIVLAFARPFYERAATAGSSAAGPRELVLVLDRSYSMGYGDRWARAQAAARQVVDALRPGDRATLVFFAKDAEVAVRSTTDTARVRAAIEAARPGPQGTRFAPALKLAASVLAQSRLPRRELVLISDFQKQGWNRDEAVHLPERVVVTPVPISDPDPVNASVGPVKLERRRAGDQERVLVSAIVTNRSARPLANVPVALELDGRTVETRAVRLEPHGSTLVDFAPAPLWAARTRGRVVLGPDGLERDNVFYFVLPPAPPVVVELVERAGAPREASFYLRQALAIGDKPRFELRPRTVDQAAGLGGDRTAVAILNDLPLGAGPVTTGLRRFVEQGGGALVVLGERASWPDQSFAGQPGRLGPIVDRPGRGGMLASLDYGHPIFEPFRAPRSGEFATARVFRYRRLEVADGARVLARFDDGAPALVEATLGAGRLLLWTSTLDSFWNDLALKPVFLPFLHQTMRYLSRYVEPKPWVSVGDVIEPAAIEWRPREVERRRALAARAPSGRHVAGEAAADVLPVAEQGFYEVRLQGDADPLVVAANVDLAESDLTPMDPAEFAGAVTGRVTSSAPVDEAAGVGRATPASERHELWWALLLAGVGLLAVETVVANRLARAGPIG